jgi:hypothetical protein
MPDGNASFLSVLVAVLLGGSTLQFVSFLLRRRYELRTLDVAANKVDAEADSVILSSAAASAALAAQMRDQAMARVQQLQGDLAACHENQRVLAERALSDRRHRLQAEAEVAYLRVENNRLRRDADLPERVYETPTAPPRIDAARLDPARIEERFPQPEPGATRA